MAEKRTIELEVKESGFQSLKAQLRAAQADVAALSDKFGATSKQAVEAAKSAAILKDKIQDAKSLTDAFNPDAKFKAFSGALVGVAGGFSAVTGALGAFGKQNEEVEAALLKVQSAMALASGLQAVGESIDSFKQLGAVLKANALIQKVLTAAQYVYNAAMAANPVGAIVVAITALIAAGYALIKMFSSSNDANAKNEAAVKKNTAALKEQVKANEKSSEALKIKNGHEYEMAKASGASSEALRKLALKHADEQIALEKASLATAKNTYEKEKNTLANLKNAGATDEVIEKQKELTIEARKNATKEREDLQSAVDNKASIIRANEVEVRNELTNSNKKKVDDAKAANDKINENQKIANEKRKEDLNKINEFTSDAAKANLDATKTEQQLELDAIENKYKEQIALATKYGKSTTEIIDAQKNEENLVNTKYIQIELDAEQLKQDKLNEIAATKKAKDAQDAADKVILDKAAADAEIAAAKAVAEQKAAIQMQGLDVALQGVQLIKGVFEQQKGIQKAAVIAESAIGIAKMIIANKLANVAALATPQAIATSGAAAVPVIALNNISTGIGIAANIAATGKALKTLGGGTAPTAPPLGGGGGGGGGVSAPNFNIVGNSGINQLAELGGQPIQAYVVSGEVTSAQALDRNRIQNATF